MVWRRIRVRRGPRESRKEVVRSASSSTRTPSPVGLAWAAETEEVRLAMGWNGGVSLAVWMGGVAVELDEARRAKPDSRPAKGAEKTGELYAAVCRVFNQRL